MVINGVIRHGIREIDRYILKLTFVPLNKKQFVDFYHFPDRLFQEFDLPLITILLGV